MKEKSLNLQPLNGIRGFAVLLVLLSHAANVDIFPVAFINFSGAGHYGVFLFFVLSSFLLTRQFLVSDRWEAFTLPALRRYFLRRFLRIYPLFTAALLVYFLLNTIGLPVIPVSGEMFVKSLLLMDAVGIFWTVPVEFQFYFILPLIAAALTLPVGTVAVLINGGIFCILWSSFFPPEFNGNLLSFLPIFIMGSLSARLHCSVVNRQKGVNVTGGKNAIWYNRSAFLFMMSFIVFTPAMYALLFPFAPLENVVLQHQFLLFSLLSSGFVLLSLFSNGMVHWLMESRFFVFWGRISFSAYLGHNIILAAVHELNVLPSSVQFVLFFAGTALFSYLSYSYFERPLSTMSFGQKKRCYGVT